MKIFSAGEGKATPLKGYWTEVPASREFPASATQPVYKTQGRRSTMVGAILSGGCYE